MADLFDRLQIGSMKLKNRIAMGPMGTTGEADGAYTMDGIYYFEERARGGAGLIITGANVVSTKYEPRPCTELSNFHHVERLNMLIDRCHHYGAKVCVQLSPGLGRQQFTDPFTPPYSAGACTSFWFPKLICKPFAKEDIAYLVQRVGYSASLAVAAGADAVELHACGGYLLDQFQSTMWNDRTDEYGGSLKNRMRFTCECIAAIKANVPKGFPVLVKFTPYHGVEGGRTLDEGIEMAKILEGAGADALHVDVGCYEAWYKAISTVYAPEGHQLPVVSAIKNVATVPVLGQGKLFDPVKAEEALADGTLDEVVLAHQMLADPFWPKKVEAGHLDDIRPCIGCNECLLSGFSGKHYYCAVNPECYAERDYMRTQVLKKGVEVVLGKDATTNEIVSFGADKVILTTGAHSIVPPIEGVEKAVISDAILLGKIQAQGHVVVIGGGLVGCETACMAVETAEDVTIVEVLDEVLKTAGHCLNNDQALKAMMEERQVRTICSAKVTKIEDGSLSYEKDGATEMVPCDMAVLACGYRPNDGLAAELEGRVKDLSVIGDAEAPRKILTAVHEGYHAIRVME